MRFGELWMNSIGNLPLEDDTLNGQSVPNNIPVALLVRKLSGHVVALVIHITVVVWFAIVHFVAWTSIIKSHYRYFCRPVHRSKRKQISKFTFQFEFSHNLYRILINLYAFNVWLVCKSTIKWDGNTLIYRNFVQIFANGD